ncbi:hypothetical protein K443DRAFT_680901 [Laccaria amethystina LaAM-08-1]|uniref:Uncharacterized protein n=1 Tax=Laccaria amethystina LaAM-08-1 TaxID=1095629 RepID=A0A0C9WZG3_9AGAR|nr:hypothetical protein K443DRAFT_680901 [Laccaria amethystina LaAM-08-1]
MKLRNSKETNPPKFMAPSSRERSETPPPPEEPYNWGTADDMRNWVCPEVNPHMIDTLRDVHPHTLEETFHWYARPGTPVWVLSSSKKRPIPTWRQGYVVSEHKTHFTPKGIFRSYSVQYIIGGETVKTVLCPGLEPELKPDTPQVRQLLREAGYPAAP